MKACSCTASALLFLSYDRGNSKLESIFFIYYSPFSFVEKFNSYKKIIIIEPFDSNLPYIIINFLTVEKSFASLILSHVSLLSPQLAVA